MAGVGRTWKKGNGERESTKKSMDKGLVVKSITLLTNPREKKTPNKTVTAKMKILCPILE